MFTGIIEGFGTIRDIRPTGQGSRIAIEADFDLDHVKIGDSIATNGACLTAVTLENHRFEVDMAPETMRRTAFSTLRVGSRVNLERALRLSDRLDGHLVSGHIDGVGTIVSKERASNAVIVKISVSPDLSRYMIEKGSVAVDGISLTINAVSGNTFDLNIIPHTAEVTTIGSYAVGTLVNIEVDQVARYLERLLGKDRNDLDLEFLREHGYA